MPERKRIVVAVTGASGAAYARKLVECLVAADVDVSFIASPWGRRLFVEELGITRLDAESLVGHPTERLTVYSYGDVGSDLSSGSFPTDGMIVCPCSSNTLAAIAAGLGDNAIARAAAVTLKECRRLVLAHREMPLTQIDLRNMLRLSEAGAVICPASPGFYMAPTSVDDLIDFVVGKLLDLVGVQHQLNTRWSDMLRQDRAVRTGE